MKNCGPSIHKYLVGGIPTPLKNDGLRQLGRLFHSQVNGKKSCSKPPTRKYYGISWIFNRHVHRFSMVFPWFSHGFPMNSQTSHGPLRSELEKFGPRDGFAAHVEELRDLLQVAAWQRWSCGVLSKIWKYLWCVLLLKKAENTKIMCIYIYIYVHIIYVYKHNYKHVYIYI